MNARITLGLVVLACVGCQTIVTPPPHVIDPVTVYLTDYGRHSSLVLPAPSGGYDEFAFGDWDFFVRGDTRWWVAGRALLASRQSAIGRRHVALQPADVDLPGTLGAKRLMHFRASRQRVEALREDLQAMFTRSTTMPVQSSYSLLEHVPDTEHYWGLQNCNHITARWLERLGCNVDGPAVWSNFTIAQSAPSTHQ